METIGIGRPANADWLEEAASVIEAVMAEFGVPQLTLELRDIAGVNYVSAEELAELSRGQPSTTGERTLEQIEFLIASMINDPAANSNVWSFTEEIEIGVRGLTGATESKSKTLQRLSVKLRDNESSRHQPQYVIQAEKAALRDILGLGEVRKPKNPHSTPQHLLKLGGIRGLPERDGVEFRRRIKLPRPLILEPVGPLKL